jgi:hypothetical protein
MRFIFYIDSRDFRDFPYSFQANNRKVLLSISVIHGYKSAKQTKPFLDKQI